MDKEFLKSEAIALSVMIDRIKAAGARTAVFIIDACRNNPYASATTRGVGGTRGLAAVAPPKGTFVMYSAGQGQSALDRLSDDDRELTSVYTRTLRAKMLVEGLAITDLARVVRDEVEAAASSVNHEQRPAYYDELSGAPFYFLPPKAQPATVTKPVVQPPISVPPAVAAPPETRRSTTICPEERQARSLEGRQRAMISFRNDRSEPVRVYWLDYSGGRKFYGEIAGGQRHDQQTYLTHPWVVTDVDGNCLGFYLPQEQPREYVLH